MNEKPSHIDLFSGIGGFSLAFEAVGFQTIGFSEIDPYACAVLAARWPGVPNYGDLRNVPAIQCDVLTGGFPCQPFSVAGEQGGASDDRFLWPEMFAAIERCGPRYVLAENVPGIIAMELDRCISDLESIGYTCRPVVIPACAVDADHERGRVWIVAHTYGKRKQQQEWRVQKQRRRIGTRIEAPMAHADRLRLEVRMQAGANRRNVEQFIQRPRPSIGASAGIPKDYWSHKPVVGRGIHGIPNRAHRLKCLGNSIVPQVAQIFAQEIYNQLMTP